MDVDVPAADVDVVHEEADESLALVEVEFVDGAPDPGGEVVDAAAELVVGGELSALGDEGVVFRGGASLAFGEFSASALGFGEVEHAGLVEVGQASPFGLGGVEAALEPVELGSEKFVVGGGGVGEDGFFAGEEQFGVEQRGAELVEDELVEGVGADHAFGAAAFGADGGNGVAVEAFVVADAAAGSVAATAPVDGSTGAAGADDETA